MPRRALCTCGQLRVTCEGEPVRVSMCHCLACQRRSGSIFAVQARFPRERVNVEGDTLEYVRVGDEGSRIMHRFCPKCGSTVYYTMDTQPELLAVAVGAFADPMFPPPRFSVYESRKHAWARTPEGDVEHMD
jgi:hypothetical protein